MGDQETKPATRQSLTVASKPVTADIDDAWDELDAGWDAERPVEAATAETRAEVAAPEVSNVAPTAAQATPTSAPASTSSSRVVAVGGGQQPLRAGPPLPRLSSRPPPKDSTAPPSRPLAGASDAPASQSSPSVSAVPESRPSASSGSASGRQPPLSSRSSSWVPAAPPALATIPTPNDVPAAARPMRAGAMPSALGSSAPPLSEFGSDDLGDSEPPRSLPRASDALLSPSAQASVPPDDADPAPAMAATSATPLNGVPDFGEAPAGHSTEADSELAPSSAAEVLNQAPDLSTFAVAPTEKIARSEGSAAQASSPPLEPTSLSPSVADLDAEPAGTAPARPQARSTSGLKWGLSLAAVVLLGAGAVVAVVAQRSSVQLNEAEPRAKSGAVDAVAARPAAPSPTPVASVASEPAAPVASEHQEAESAQLVDDDPAAAAGDRKEPAFSEVIVRISPLGAQIYDEGRLLAVTAARVRLESGEPKTLTVHLEGHRSRQVLVDGSSESVNIVMRPSPGAVATADEDSGSMAPVEPGFMVREQQRRAKAKAKRSKRSGATERR